MFVFYVWFLFFVFCSLQVFVCGHLLRARQQLGLSLSVDSDPAAAISEAWQEIYILDISLIRDAIL